MRAQARYSSLIDLRSVSQTLSPNEDGEPPTAASQNYGILATSIKRTKAVYGHKDMSFRKGVSIDLAIAKQPPTSTIPSTLEIERLEKHRLQSMVENERKLKARVRKLELDEEKMMRKISLTKSQAERILEAKRRNELNRAEKTNLKKQIHLQLKNKREVISQASAMH